MTRASRSMRDIAVDTEDVDLLTLMVALAADVPAVPVARATLALAKFLALHQHALSDEQAATLLALGAGLWQRSVILDDTVPEIDAMLLTKQ